MPLKSRLFRNDPKLEAASVSDPAHITLGASGAHVQKIQSALNIIDRAAIDASELGSRRYGASTANAVLKYKQRRNIINHAYERTADNIVGKMTVASLDREMFRKEAASGQRCNCGPLSTAHLILSFSIPPNPAPAPPVNPPSPPVPPRAIIFAPKGAKLAQDTLDVLKAITDGSKQPADSFALATQALQTHYLCTPAEVTSMALQVKGHLEAVVGVLKRAAEKFVWGVPGDPDGGGAYAYSRSPRDGKIYINPSFDSLAEFGRRLVLVHEAFHSLSASNVDWCQNPGNDAGRSYRKVPKDLRSKNAYTLSQFVLHIQQKAEKTLDVETDQFADLAP